MTENIRENTAKQKILSIDIGGSRVKATLVDAEGQSLMDYERTNTPAPATPGNILSAIVQLADRLPGFEKISTGFPGYVKNGVVLTAPNLGTDYWKGTNLAKLLSDKFGKPAKVLNDADMQGLGIAMGNGFEIVATLGTGFGTAFLHNGTLLPHMEFAHHPVSKERDASSARIKISSLTIRPPIRLSGLLQTEGKFYRDVSRAHVRSISVSLLSRSNAQGFSHYCRSC